VPAARVRTTHLGVAPQYLDAAMQPPVVEYPYVLTVSTHLKRKNTLAVVDALKGLQGHPEMHLVIAGVIPEDQRPELEAHIAKLGLTDRVNVIGYVTNEQLISLYQHAKVMLFPSFYEGFGFPVVEAAMCKCPVITSTTSCLPEVVGDQHWLVDPTDQQQITDKLQELLDLSPAELKKVIARNYDHAKQFTWKRTAEVTQAAFIDAAQQSGW